MPCQPTDSGQRRPCNTQPRAQAAAREGGATAWAEGAHAAERAQRSHLVRLNKARHYAQDGGFSGAAGPDDANCLAAAPAQRGGVSAHAAARHARADVHNKVDSCEDAPVSEAFVHVHQLDEHVVVAGGHGVRLAVARARRVSAAAHTPHASAAATAQPRARTCASPALAAAPLPSLSRLASREPPSGCASSVTECCTADSSKARLGGGALRSDSRAGARARAAVAAAGAASRAAQCDGAPARAGSDARASSGAVTPLMPAAGPAGSNTRCSAGSRPSCARAAAKRLGWRGAVAACTAFACVRGPASAKRWLLGAVVCAAWSRDTCPAVLSSRRVS